MRRTAIAIASIAVASLPSAARADDDLPDEPAPSLPCLPPPSRSVVPACAEWAWWVSGGGSSIRRVDRERDARAYATFAIGTELTFGVLRYHGFPSGAYGGARGLAEVRAGPWIAAATRSSGALVEGGVKVHDGGTFHPSWGTFDLRVGAGYGRWPEGRAPHVNVTLGYGVVSVLARYRDWGYGSAQGLPPDPLAVSTVARVVLTVRRTIERESAAEVFVGVELSPTFFAPPVTWWRVAGGPPS